MGGQLATGLAGITLDAASAATPSPRIVELIRFHGVPVTVSDLHGHGLQAVANAMTDAAMTEAREADLAEAVALLRYFVDWVEGALCVVAESRLPSDPDLVARRADVEGARAFLSRHPAPEVGSCPPPISPSSTRRSKHWARRSPCRRRSRRWTMLRDEHVEMARERLAS